MEINKQRSTVRSSASEAIIDQGLRSYMLKVYNYMASGVLLTGVIALLFFKMAVVTSPEGQIVGLTNFGNSIYASGLKWVIMLAPLAVVFYMSFGIAKMSAAKAQTTFWVFAALMGLITFINFFNLHRRKYNKSFLYYCRNFWSNEYLRLYN